MKKMKKVIVDTLVIIKKSPLDVKGINIEISRDEIIKAIKDSRRK